MNIKEHIEAGHYPLDDKGRAILPTSDPNVRAVIAATDCPVGDYMIGWSIANSPKVEFGGGTDYCWKIAWWRRDGEPVIDREKVRLLPPPPRKVKVTLWAAYARDTGHLVATEHSRDQLGRFDRRSVYFVELTGEYEEPQP